MSTKYRQNGGLEGKKYQLEVRLLKELGEGELSTDQFDRACRVEFM